VRPQHHQGRHVRPLTTGTLNSGGGKSLAFSGSSILHARPASAPAAVVRSPPHDTRDAARHRQLVGIRRSIRVPPASGPNERGSRIVGAHSGLQEAQKEQPGQPVTGGGSVQPRSRSRMALYCVRTEQTLLSTSRLHAGRDKIILVFTWPGALPPVGSQIPHKATGGRSHFSQYRGRTLCRQ